MLRVTANSRRFEPLTKVIALKLRKLIVRANVFLSQILDFSVIRQLRTHTNAEYTLGSSAAYALTVAHARPYAPEAYRNPEYG